MSEGIRLRDDGDEVHAGAQTLHDLDVKGLKPTTEDVHFVYLARSILNHLRVSCGADEIQASVHSEVTLLLAPGLLLLAHIRLMLIVNEVDDGRPRVAVVHVVTKSGGVDDGQLRLELLLLQFRLDDFNFRKFIKLLVMAAVVVLRRGQLS